MAKIICIVNYDEKTEEVTSTYQIEFDKKQDTFELRSETENLALRVMRKDPVAQKLIKRWKERRKINTPVASGEPEPSDVIVIDPLIRKGSLPKPRSTKPFTFSFVSAFGKFSCGYFEADPKTGKKKFEAYNRTGQSFPDIP
jgi:hypothetical protein